MRFHKENPEVNHLKDKEYIKKILPHRDPILLVDGIIDEEQDLIIAYREIKKEDPIFKGHFPDYKIYPGVYIIEGFAQTAGLMLLKKKGKTPLFLGIQNAKFRSEVKPGDKLEYVVQKQKEKLGIVFLSCSARVGDTVVATANISVGVK